jgi:tetratricopeptide (TPR) repeat protein
MSSQGSLGQRLRDLRVSRGISQAQLAFPELSDSYVSLIESDKRTPAPEVIELLARKLDCSPAYLESGVTDEAATELRRRLQFGEISLENGEAAEARDAFAKVIADSDLDALPDLSYEAHWGFARALEACGELEGAIANYEGLVANVSPKQAPERWAWLHIALCRCHRERGSFGAATDVGEEGLARLTEALGHWTESGVMLGATLLSVFCEQGDMVRARQFSSRLIRHAEGVGSVRARAAAYWEAAIAADYRGDFDEALRLGERASALLGESDDTRNLARLREERGRLLLRARPDQAGQARDLLLEAQKELAETSNGPVDNAWCLTTIAKAEIVLGNPIEAIRLAEEALECAGDGSRLVVAGALIVLGHGYVLLDRHDEAAKTLQDAGGQLQSMQAQGMHTSRQAAQVWFELAEVLGRSGDERGRMEAYRQACASMGIR